VCIYLETCAFITYMSIDNSDYCKNFNFQCVNA
jgi:hypothetical protein